MRSRFYNRGGCWRAHNHLAEKECSFLFNNTYLSCALRVANNTLIGYIFITIFQWLKKTHFADEPNPLNIFKVRFKSIIRTKIPRICEIDCLFRHNINDPSHGPELISGQYKATTKIEELQRCATQRVTSIFQLTPIQSPFFSPTLHKYTFGICISNVAFREYIYIYVIWPNR